MDKKPVSPKDSLFPKITSSVSLSSIDSYDPETPREGNRPSIFGSTSYYEDRPYRQNILTLCFSNPNVEETFTRIYMGTLLRIKGSLCIAVAAAALVSIWLTYTEGWLVKALWWGVTALVLLALMVCAFLTKYIIPHIHVLLFILVVGCTSLMTIAHLLNATGRTHPSAIGLMLIGVLVGMRPKFVYATVYAASAALLYILLYQGFKVKDWNVTKIAGRALEISCVIVMGLVATYQTERFMRNMFVSQQILEKEKQRVTRENVRANELLRNVLPQKIVEKMKAEKVPLDSFSIFFRVCSVLQSDVVSFTVFSSTRDAETVIRAVNSMFSKFDRECQALHLEKLKTIGDAYICVGGVPIEDPAHDIKIAEMGLRMVGLMADVNSEDATFNLSIRVGIASGSCTAGIVGELKLCYDISGDALHHAELMEQTSNPNRVQCTEDMVKSLEASFDIERNHDKEHVRYFLARRRGSNIEVGDTQTSAPLPYEQHGNEGRDVFWLFSEQERKMQQSVEEMHEFDGQLSRLTTFFKDPDCERDFRMGGLHAAIRDSQLFVAINAALLFVFLPAFLGLIFLESRRKPWFIYLYVLAVVHFLIFLVYFVWWTRRRVQVAPSELGGSSGKIFQRKRARSTSFVDSISSTHLKLSRRKLNFTLDSHILFMFVYGFGILAACSIIVLVVIAQNGNGELGKTLMFMLMPVNVYASSYFFIPFPYRILLLVSFTCAVFVEFGLVQKYMAHGYRFQAAEEGADVFTAICSVLITCVSMYTIELSLRKGFVLASNAVYENAKAQLSIVFSEKLLLNVLPQSALARLRRFPEKQIVDSIASASVMFVYIHGLEPTQRSGSAYEAMRELNSFLSLLDTLCAKLGAEKIKTSPYMIVSGCPDPNNNHAEVLVKLGMEYMKAVHNFNSIQKKDIHIKIGINTGRLGAGVLGKNKFIYDVFGDTVNVAARLTSSSEWGRIQVSAATVELTKTLYSYESRGSIELKGKGAFQTFFVTDSTGVIDVDH